MSLIKPRALRPGTTFGVVSPASTPRRELVDRGVAALEALGYHARVFSHALDRGPLYYAGTAQERAADLHAAFADDGIDAIICTRGGWGSAELLPLLDRELIRAHPKPFLGYSDQTSLHLWLRDVAGIVSFHAPMVAADFSRTEGVDLESWHAALSQTKPWSLGTEAGLRILKPGVGEGELSGGCLAIYAEALGTPYAPRPGGGVLFLEDIGVKPYQWDRMLLHLRYAGALEAVTGIVFGDMAQCCAPDEAAALEDSLLHALRGFEGPIAIGLRSGHVGRHNITLPFGVRVRLEAEGSDEPTLKILEAAVEV